MIENARQIDMNRMDEREAAAYSGKTLLFTQPLIHVDHAALVYHIKTLDFSIPMFLFNALLRQL